jgi:hypothetical protein
MKSLSFLFLQNGACRGSGLSNPPSLKPFRDMAIRCALAIALLALASCGRSEADYQKLLDENARLKAELAKLTAAADQAQAGDRDGNAAPGPNLDVNIDDLWAQRFDDNQFRSRERLADKVLRVTGQIDSTSENSLTLLGTTPKFGNFRMRVNLKDEYAQKMTTELASLEVGSTVTVQGTFIFDRNWLNDAVFVDKRTGQVLSSQRMVDQARAAAHPTQP